jgi:hypothetical protein
MELRWTQVDARCSMSGTSNLKHDRVAPAFPRPVDPTTSVVPPQRSDAPECRLERWTVVLNRLNKKRKQHILPSWGVIISTLSSSSSSTLLMGWFTLAAGDGSSVHGSETPPWLVWGERFPLHVGRARRSHGRSTAIKAAATWIAHWQKSSG